MSGQSRERTEPSSAPLPSLRVLVPIAVAGLLTLVVALVSSVSPPGALARAGAGGALLTRCAKAVLGVGRVPATPVVGSADAQVVSHLAVFRRMRSSADRLPAAAQLREALAGAGATSYDPSVAVLLTGNVKHEAVYGVPATISLPVLPAGCGSLPQFAGFGAYLASQAEESGSGPGACMISTQLVQSEPSGSSLPGAATPKPSRTLTVAGAVCNSEVVLSGYVGALGNERLGSDHKLALIPDGVAAITYALSDGREFIVPVAGNLATPPAELSLQTPLRNPTAAELGNQLAAHLPTTVTESSTGASPNVTLARPVSLISDTVGSFSFLRRLLSSGPGLSSSSSSSSNGASCSARTHRCVAVTVTTTCDSHEHCHTSRTIHRYPYVGAKPPAGTTGPNTQPTGPIVARVNRVITRPRKLTLVLSGTPHRHVVVLLSVSCFSHNSAAGSAEPPLQLAVPSRTPISLPGPARAFHACDVGALVISRQRGLVHATVARS